MTKNELKAGFVAGKTLCDMMELCSGQECEIFKAEEFSLGDKIIYIPDSIRSSRMRSSCLATPVMISLLCARGTRRRPAACLLTATGSTPPLLHTMRGQSMTTRTMRS